MPVRREFYNFTLRTNRFPSSTFRTKQDIFLFSGSSIFSGGRNLFYLNTGPGPSSFKTETSSTMFISLSSHSLNIQHPYHATASPPRFHTHPGQLTPDEQITTILREAQQIYHTIYLILSRKINQKRCHCNVLQIHERHKTTLDSRNIYNFTSQDPIKIIRALWAFLQTLLAISTSESVFLRRLMARIVVLVKLKKPLCKRPPLF